MAFTNTLQRLLSGIMQFDYAGQSVGNALTSGTNISVAVQGTTALQTVSGAVVSYLNRGMLRLKLYNVTGTTPTWQFNVYANSATTGELLYQSPVISITNTTGIADFLVPFQADSAITNLIIAPVGAGTSPTGTLDFEYAGSQ